jgi:hypothetical protein
MTWSQFWRVCDFAYLTEKRCMFDCCWAQLQHLPAILTIISAYLSIAVFVMCDMTNVLCALPAVFAFNPLIMSFAPSQISFKPSLFSFRPVVLSFAPSFFCAGPSLFSFNPVILSVVPDVACYNPSWYTYSPKILCVTDWSQLLKYMPFLGALLNWEPNAEEEEECTVEERIFEQLREPGEVKVKVSSKKSKGQKCGEKDDKTVKSDYLDDFYPRFRIKPLRGRAAI